MARQRDPRTSATPTLHFHRSAHGMLVRMHLRLTGRHPLLGPNLDQVPDQDGGLVLDARRLDFAGPLELAATVALAHAANAKLLSTSFITADNPDVTGYMQRMASSGGCPRTPSSTVGSPPSAGPTSRA